MKRNFLFFSIIFFVLTSCFCIYLFLFKTPGNVSQLQPFVSVEIQKNLTKPEESYAESTIPPQTMEFRESFTQKRVIEEAPRMSASSDTDWWVNSGGQLIIDKGVGKTMQGDAVAGSRWYEAYKKTTPVDTDNGLHPQNIFRLVLKSRWLDYSQSVYAKITSDNISTSPSRDDSNGLFLFNRYRDGDNVYYTGLRVDGAVVIKKKYKGAYYTMAYRKILALPKYNRADNPSLLTKNAWIGIKSTVKNIDSQHTLLEFYTDIGQTGQWSLGTSVIDDNKSFGGPTLSEPGYAGIRTDFMDVQFKDYIISGGKI